MLIDLTGDTATASDVAQGKTFHLANGTQTTGTAAGGEEWVNYTLKASDAVQSGGSSYEIIGYEITYPNGVKVNLPNIPYQIGEKVGNSTCFNSWRYNSSTYMYNFGHEYGAGGNPSSGSPKYWTVTGKCPKNSTIRIIWMCQSSSGTPKSVINYNILGTSGSKTYYVSTYASSNGTSGGTYVNTGVVIDRNITGTCSVVAGSNYTNTYTINISAA